MSELRNDAFMQTYTGKKFYMLDPRPEDIEIRDIAHQLSLICRYTGAVREFYSVAQHCVHVSEIIEPEYELWGLLHDAGEAYISDIARPVKYLPEMERYRQMEKDIQRAIYGKFGLLGPEPASLKVVDKRLLMTEARDLLGPLVWGDTTHFGAPYSMRIEPWEPRRAETEFLRRFCTLTMGGE